MWLRPVKKELLVNYLRVQILENLTMRASWSPDSSLMKVDWHIFGKAKTKPLILCLWIRLYCERNWVAFVEFIVSEVNSCGPEDTSQMVPHIVLHEWREVRFKTTETGVSLHIMTASNLSSWIFNSHLQALLHMENPAFPKSEASRRVHVNPDFLCPWQVCLPICISRVTVPSYQAIWASTNAKISPLIWSSYLINARSNISASSR